MTWSLLLALALTSADAGEENDAGAIATPDAGIVATGPTSNLLRSTRVTRSEGAPNVARMADGIASEDGDVWDSPQSAILEKSGVVEWDLGTVRPIRALRIQADNNDRYIVSVSNDGARWAVLWVAPPVDLPGVQTRTAPPVSGEARFVRLTAEGGDSMYSVGELELFESQAALAAEKLTRIKPKPPPPPPPAPPFNSSFLVVFGVTALVVFYFWNEKQRSRAAQAKKTGGPPGP
jgi:hypothetical protein